MQLIDVLAPGRIAVGLSVATKQALLEKAAELLANTPGSASSKDILDSLVQREQLGSTGLGHGVAIPHGRVDEQGNVAGAVIRLAEPIEFDAPDEEKVDLFFALAVPGRCTDAHLRLLAEMAERLGSKEQRDELRRAANGRELLSLLAEHSADIGAQ